MQILFETPLSGEAYVAAQGWRMARLPSCPLHPQGGCSLSRHGTYPRVTPAGTRIPRWYCPEGHRTFSLLPDFLASRLPGTLAALERVVLHVELVGSVEAAADTLRPDDISLPSAVRWIRRRMRLVQEVLAGALQTAPALFRDCQPSITSFRDRLRGPVFWRHCAPRSPIICQVFLHLWGSPRAARIYDASNTTLGQTRPRFGFNVVTMALMQHAEMSGEQRAGSIHFRDPIIQGTGRVAG